MRVYLFRRKRTSDFALTTDLTGRNLPSSTPYSAWIFVEVLDTKNASPPLGITNIKEALCGLKALGYYIFKEHG
jgi:hypothetical protein